MRLLLGLIQSWEKDMVLGMVEDLAEVMGEDTVTKRKLTRSWMQVNLTP